MKEMIQQNFFGFFFKLQFFILSYMENILHVWRVLPEKLDKLVDYKNDVNRLIKNLYSSDYFRFYILTEPLHPSHMVSPDEWIHTKRIGLNARLKITTTHFHLLSNPYMKRCLQNGIYFQLLFNFKKS